MSKNDIMQTLQRFIAESNSVIENESLDLSEKGKKVLALQTEMQLYAKNLKKKLKDQSIAFNIDAITYAHSAIEYLEDTSALDSLRTKRETYFEFMKTLKSNTKEFAEALQFSIE